MIVSTAPVHLQSAHRLPIKGVAWATLTHLSSSPYGEVDFIEPQAKMKDGGVGAPREVTP